MTSADAYLHHFLCSQTPNEGIDRGQVTGSDVWQFFDESLIQLLHFGRPCLGRVHVFGQCQELVTIGLEYTQLRTLQQVAKWQISLIA